MTYGYRTTSEGIPDVGRDVGGELGLAALEVWVWGNVGRVGGGVGMEVWELVSHDVG